MLHTDGIAAGAFGDWREGFTQNWCSKADTALTEAERLAHRERVKAMQRQRDDDLEQRQQLAAADALKRWTAATPGTQHDYLTRKGIQPHGASIHECTGHAVAVAFNAGNLEAVAVALRSNTMAQIRVVGHTDNRGAASANDALSLDRAMSTRDWLVGRGVSATRFAVAGRGSREPLESNDSEIGRTSNRRVEILIGERSRGTVESAR